jgi:HNH endonuclease
LTKGPFQAQKSPFGCFIPSVPGLGKIQPTDSGWQERVLARVLVDDGCWEWAGGHNRDGYGTVYTTPGSGPRGAHRVIYELLVGPIPDGLEIDHLCRNRGCVNPGHMEPVSKRVNLLRGLGVGARNAAKTHCPRGHAYDAANTYISRDGKRVCRTCHRERALRRARRLYKQTVTKTATSPITKQRPHDAGTPGATT